MEFILGVIIGLAAGLLLSIYLPDWWSKRQKDVKDKLD